jgi:plastocyanin
MKENTELYKHHKNYSIYREIGKWINYYSAGDIESVHMLPGEMDKKTYKFAPSKITVQYRNGEIYNWESKYIDGYSMGQFGIAVSNDGTSVFAQTWDNGLFCFDAKTGERIWRTKSRRGITNIFVGDNTITAQLHDYAMNLLDIKTGEVIKEKRPCTAWGFTNLDNRHIVCQVTARKWEIIEAETLEVKETFTHKEFTGNHTDFCINHISLCENGNIRVAGFKNVWDKSKNPPERLPNIEFEYFLHSDYFEKLKNNFE